MSGSSQRISVEPLTPTIGAEISGVDLGNLDDETFEEIHNAWMKHLVLFFRDQTLTPEQHLAFGRRFGPLHEHPAADYADGDPALMVIHTDAQSKRNNGGGWHTDVSSDEEPPLGTILHLHELPSQGGDTLFINMYAVFESLSPAMQQFLSTLSAVHMLDYGALYGRDGHRENPRSVHPVVRTHPVTGRNALFVNPGFTRQIEGLTRGESDALLAYLFEHARQPRFQCRFKWSKHALAMWDDRCTWHMALWDYFPETRSGLRVTVKGDRPAFDPASLASADDAEDGRELSAMKL